MSYVCYKYYKLSNDTNYVGRIKSFFKQGQTIHFFTIKEINLNNNNNDVIIKGRDKREINSLVEEILEVCGIMNVW